MAPPTTRMAAVNNVVSFMMRAALQREVGMHSINKEYLFNTYCPIKFRYTFEDSLREQQGRKLNFYIIQHELEKVTN